ncbi:MAG: ABC transporter substrate-binding protein [Inquilinaceae bacterium]
MTIYKHATPIVAAGMAALLAGAATATETLVINSFGGAYEEAHRALVIEPFEALHDVEIEVVTLYSADALTQLRAQKDNPQFDVVHFSGGQEIVAAQEGLIAPIAPDELENAADLYPFAVDGLSRGEGPVYSVAVVGLLHDTTAGPAPTSWTDLLSAPDKSMLAIADISNTYGLQTLLMLNQIQGGGLDDIQPGLDAVTGLIDGDAAIFTSSPELQQAFAQNAVTLAPYAQDYAYTLRKAGLPVAFVQPEEGSPAIFITANAVAGRPNLDLAKKFIDFSLRAEAQAGWAEALRYTPVNRTVELPGDLAEEVVTGEEAVGRLLRFDPTEVAEKRAGWVDQWNRAVAR